jgi:methyl-accepting chemotaxis protein
MEGLKMQWFKNFRTMTKILTLVAIMLILLLVVSIVGYNISTQIATEMKEMYVNYATPAILMSEARTLAVQNRRFILSIMTSTSESEMSNYERRIAENQAEASDLISNYEKTNVTPQEEALLAELRKARDEAARKRSEAVELAKASKNDREIYDRLNERLGSNGDIAVAEDNYYKSFDNLVNLLIKMASDMNEMASQKVKSGTVVLITSSIVAAFLGIALGFLIAKMITNPIVRTQKSIKQFSDGDLLCEFDASGRDELAQMGRGLQEMTDNLKGIIGSVKDASGHINETAQEFSALAEQTNASVEEFRANVEEMGANLNVLASTGEEVNASVEEVAAGAQATAEKGTDIARQVDEAMNAGNSGMDAVRNAVTGIEGVAKNAAEAARSVQELGARTRQIQGFVAQIGGIADQTNLLALNAAIEAARAGDAGRGFAVVAEEVRKLAEDSNVAAKNIAELAETITGDLDGVVNISLENAKASEEAKGLSRRTEELISSMITYLKGISGATQDLAAVSQEQAASSEEIAEAVQNIATRVGNAAEAGDNIRTGVGEVASAAERMAQGAEGLSNLAGELIEILTFFKMDDSGRKNNSLGISRMKALPARR